MTQPHVIAFATQKGGAGKSTIGTHMASALCYYYGYKVAMVDCDYPQNSLHAYRLEEQQRLQSESAFQARLIKQGVPPYPVIISSVEKAVASIEGMLDQGYDFILVDTPGTVNVMGLPELLRLVDYIFLPIEPDKGSIASTMSYMAILGQFVQSRDADSNLQGYYAFWNKFVKAEKKAIYEKTEALFKEKEMPLLTSRVELLMTYKENRSTMFPLPERDLNRLGLGQLIMEILTLVVGEGAVTPSGKTIAYTPPPVEPTPAAVEAE